MKQLIFSTATIFLLTFATSCSDSKEVKEEEHEHAAMYKCPMKCEGDKTYDAPGKCPVCNMEMTAVEQEAHEH